MTYLTQSKTTFAILFGCDDGVMEKVRTRLDNAEGAACHPLLLVGIFAELERARQVALVTEGIATLLRITSSISAIKTDDDTVSTEDESETAIDAWLDIYYLKIGLQSWKRQLLKMISHVDELSAMWSSSVGGTGCEGSQVLFESTARLSGNRIKERLMEILGDYDEKISECDMIMEGTILANSLVCHPKDAFGRQLTCGRPIHRPT